MAFAFVAEGNGQSGDQNTVTSTGIDTSGSRLLIAVLVGTGSGAGTGVSDSKSNSWTLARKETGSPSGTALFVSIYYCANPTSVGSSHTASATGTTGLFPGISLFGFSGTVAGSPVDQQNGTTAAASSGQPGSVTPLTSNQVVIQGAVSTSTTGGPTINGGYTLRANLASTVNAVGIGDAYLIETTIAATNPTWSWTTAVGLVMGAVTFRLQPTGMLLVF